MEEATEATGTSAIEVGAVCTVAGSSRHPSVLELPELRWRSVGGVWWWGGVGVM